MQPRLDGRGSSYRTKLTAQAAQRGRLDISSVRSNTGHEPVGLQGRLRGWKSHTKFSSERFYFQSNRNERRRIEDSHVC